MAYRVVTMIVSLLLSSVSVAEDILLQTLYKMPTNVVALKQVCPWKSSSAKGTIRLMQVKEQGADRLYVQWLRQGIAGAKADAISTIAIKELNGKQYYRFELPDGKVLKGACSIDTIIENVIDERRFQMTLYLMAPGEYEYHVTRFMDGEL